MKFFRTPLLYFVIMLFALPALVSSISFAYESKGCSPDFITALDELKSPRLTFSHVTCRLDGTFYFEGIRYRSPALTTDTKVRYFGEWGAFPRQSDRLCALMGFKTSLANTSPFARVLTSKLETRDDQMVCLTHNKEFVNCESREQDQWYWNNIHCRN